MWILITQGIYYLVSGLWPIIHIGSFMKVTDPKTDLWLVKTVGAIITAIACVLIFAYANNELSDAIKLLSILSAAVFAMVDLYYPLKSVISKVYMIDGVIQIMIIGAWLFI
jgi:hypothetical protein